MSCVARPISLLLMVTLYAHASLAAPSEVLPFPDRLVVLTFHDVTKSDSNHVAPVLRRYAFGASFCVTNGLRDRSANAAGKRYLVARRGVAPCEIW
jgi:peptidoglycan/xylan/chitin deacetylase (PgdA/CDA1 family)